MAENMLSSPTSTTRKPHSMAVSVPLNSTKRQRPIHPDLPEVKVPNGELKAYQYHPVSCEPFTAEELQRYMLRELQKQHKTPDSALKAQQEAIREVKQRLQESEQKRRDIDREMEEKERVREIERKVFHKQGKGKVGGP